MKDKQLFRLGTIIQRELDILDGYNVEFLTGINFGENDYYHNTSDNRGDARLNVIMSDGTYFSVDYSPVTSTVVVNFYEAISGRSTMKCYTINDGTRREQAGLVRLGIYLEREWNIPHNCDVNISPVFSDHSSYLYLMDDEEKATVLGLVSIHDTKFYAGYCRVTNTLYIRNVLCLDEFHRLKTVPRAMDAAERGRNGKS
ncbi:MAG: hypothetical protein GY748_23285 [Planctomycetaceae bacterium]|nr:hypothetical protein [Planctomycetaceae bacterium]